MAKRIAVIMAGGSGERFWPLSQGSRPKQLLKLTDHRQTMLEEAVARIVPLVGVGNVILAIGAPILEPVRTAGIVEDACIWSEPAKRNTLGCLAWMAANLLARKETDVTVGVLTADHAIKEPQKFRDTVAAAMEVAEQEGGIVTIGMVPDRPETGFGYVEIDKSATVATQSGRTAFRSKSFREKPSLETAEQFVREGNFLWNGGMFFFRLDVFLAELQSAQPESRRIVDEMADALREGDEARAREAFERLPSISIDYAVMERARKVFVVPADFPWDDMGSWDALDRSFPRDALGNVRQGRSILIDSRENVVYNDMPNGAIAVLGVSNVVVVATDDAVLVCAKDQAQRVREIVAELNAAKG